MKFQYFYQANNKKYKRLSQREYQIPCATSLPKVASVGEGLNAIDPSFLPPCQRMGIMAAFKEFSSFKELVFKCMHIVESLFSYLLIIMILSALITCLKKK